MRHAHSGPPFSCTGAWATPFLIFLAPANARSHRSFRGAMFEAGWNEPRDHALSRPVTCRPDCLGRAFDACTVRSVGGDASCPHHVFDVGAKLRLARPVHRAFVGSVLRRLNAGSMETAAAVEAPAHGTRASQRRFQR